MDSQLFPVFIVSQESPVHSSINMDSTACPPQNPLGFVWTPLLVAGRGERKAGGGKHHGWERSDPTKDSWDSPETHLTINGGQNK